MGPKARIDSCENAESESGPEVMIGQGGSFVK
jgi:hypothetical protein